MQEDKSMGDEKLLLEMGTRINLTRKRLKITQEQLAEKMNVSIQMISNLELGKKAIRPENLLKLCNELGVSADYILKGTVSNLELSILSKKFKQLTPENQNLIMLLIDALN